MEETWQLRFESRDCERAGLCCCDVCWSPGGVLWHVVCPKLGYALPEVSHLTRLWPGIINRHFALLSQEFDCCPLVLSEDMAKKRLFVVHRVEKCSSGDIVHSHPSSFSVFQVVSRFITGIFLLSIFSMQGFSVGAVGFRCSMVTC